MKLTKIHIMFCAVVGSTVIPFVLLCLLPVLIYRWILSIVYPLLSRPTLKILSPLTSIYASEDKETHVKMNILVEIQFGEQLDYGGVLTAVSDRLINAKGSKGRALYPELTSYVHRFMGYYFWRKEANFQIEDHVQHVSQKPEFNLKEAFLQEAFDAEKSPWKMLVIGTESDRRILFKFHHTLGDGYAILNAFMACTEGTQTHARKTSKLPWWKILIFPILAVYDLLVFNTAEGTTPTAWRNNTISAESAKFRIYSKPRAIPKHVISDASKNLSTSFTSTLFGGLGAGLRTFFAQNNDKSIPEVISAFVPFPASSHTKQLDNSFGIAIVDIPTGSESAVDGIRITENKINAITESTYPITFVLYLKLYGLLPTDSYRILSRPLPMFISTFPGPRKTLKLYGNSIVGMNFQMHMGRDFPLIINTLTYEDTLTYVIGGDPSSFTEESIEDLSSFIYQAFTNLTPECTSEV